MIYDQNTNFMENKYIKIAEILFEILEI